MLDVMIEPTRTRGHAWSVALLFGLFLSLHLLLVHASHVQVDHSHNAEHPQPLDVTAVIIAHSFDLTHGVQACPVPDLIAPRIQWLSDLLPAIAWFATALVALGVLLRRTTRVWESPIRPPGPARQALLQRFTL
jgi:hypothetical protein